MFAKIGPGTKPVAPAGIRIVLVILRAVMSLGMSRA